MTLPGSPRSRTQKYRLTALGRQVKDPQQVDRAPRSFGAGERRQSFWPDDNYFGRSVETIIWYLGGAGFDHGPTGSFTEAEVDGRQDTAGCGSSGRYKREVG